MPRVIRNILFLAIAFALVLSHAAPAAAECYPDRQDFSVTCAATCHYPAVCVQDSENPAYCFYDYVVNVCHDGGYDECCDTDGLF